MLEQPPIPSQHIIECLYTAYGIDLLDLAFLPLGADMNTSVYKAETRQRVFYFVKLISNFDRNTGIDIVGHLHHAGIQQIIPPVQTTHGLSYAQVGDLTLIVYPFIEGHNGFDQALSDEQWILLGKALRRIHDLDIPGSLKNKLRRETYSPQWRGIVQSLYPVIHGQASGDEIAVRLHAFINDNLAAIQQLVDRAGQLARQIQHQSSSPVLCHSDIHAGNVLISGEDTLYIVDWDDPILAPRERDLMFIGGGVGNAWNRTDEEALFYKGYGKIALNQTILAYYRHERIVEDIALYAQKILLTANGGADRLIMYQHFTAMFAPDGVVDRAFQTCQE